MNRLPLGTLEELVITQILEVPSELLPEHGKSGHLHQQFIALQEVGELRDGLRDTRQWYELALAYHLNLNIINSCRQMMITRIPHPRRL